MKKILIALILLLVPALCSAGQLQDKHKGVIEKKNVPGAPSYATPEWVKDNTVYDTTFENDVSLGTVTNGNFLVMVICGSIDQVVTGVTTSTSNTTSWTFAGIAYSATHNVEANIYWACATGAGTVSAKPTGTPSDSGFTMTEYSGVACTSPQVGALQSDVASGGAETGFATGTIAATQTHNLLFGVWASETSDQTITWGSGWNQKEDVNSHYHKTADKVITNGSGNYDCSGSFTSSDAGWVVGFVMFKAKEN